MDKENWINNALESVNGIKRAVPGEFIFPKILHRLKQNLKDNIYISRRKAAIGFLSILLLAVLNAGAFLINQNSDLSYQNPNTIVEEYFPSHTNNLEQYFNK